MASSSTASCVPLDGVLLDNVLPDSLFLDSVPLDTILPDDQHLTCMQRSPSVKRIDARLED
jgi:hypothetical protein